MKTISSALSHSNDCLEFHSKTTLLIPWPWQPVNSCKALPTTIKHERFNLSFFRSCFPLPCLTVELDRVRSSTIQQMVSEIILSCFLSALAAKHGFYYGTYGILYRFSGSINTQTKLRKKKQLFWKPKKKKRLKKDIFKLKGMTGKVEQMTGVGR